MRTIRLLAHFTRRWRCRGRADAVAVAGAVILVSASCSDRPLSSSSTISFVSSDRSDWTNCIGLVREPRLPGGWLSVSYGIIFVQDEDGPDRIAIEQTHQREVRVHCDAPVATYHGAVRIQKNGRVVPGDEVIELQRAATECADDAASGGP